MTSSHIVVLLLVFAVSAAILPAGATEGCVVYEGKEGPGKGKHIVLLAGDEEYRSEEALPQLAKILAERHGFKCTVSFSVNPADGTIDPNNSSNMPGFAELATADACILSLRFRRPPDNLMKFFVDYVNAGKPVIGLRTSTHGFSGIPGTSPYKAYNSFGKKVLGEEWVNHWGGHKREATKGIIEEGAKDDPILKGVTDVFGDTDVYEAYPPADAKILVRGQVLKGMKFEDAPADYKRKRSRGDKGEQGINDPMMPVIWTRLNKSEGGKENKVLCSTMGSSTDLQNEGLRRVIVNGVYWGLGMDVPTKADVTIVGEYKPTMYGFNSFTKGVKPSDHALK